MLRTARLKMTNWLTQALALGFAASEVTGSLWKNSTSLSLSQEANESNSGYNPGNIVLDYMSLCTGISFDKESCLVSTTLPMLMSLEEDEGRKDYAQSSGCNPPDITDENLQVILTDSRAKCAATGQFISDENFRSTKNEFQSLLANETCFFQMCKEFVNPTSSFMEIKFDEAKRCAGVDVDVDKCIHNHLLAIFFDGGDSLDNDTRRLFRNLQEDAPCNIPGDLELYVSSSQALQYAQLQCPSVSLSSSEFDAIVSDLITILGSPQCFGQSACHDATTEEGQDESAGLNYFDIAVKYIEQCAELEIDMDDCLVSTIMDTLFSNPRMTGYNRHLQEQDSSCTAPDFERGMILELLSGARQHCSRTSVEYSEDEYLQRVNLLLDFFDASSCWVSLCNETVDEPSKAFITLFIEYAAECADVELEIANQCLVEGVLDLLLDSEGMENQDDARRSLRLLSRNETGVFESCRPSEEDVGPFIGMMLSWAESNCTKSGEKIEQEDLLTSYTELVKLFTAPRKCWGEEDSEKCNESQDDLTHQVDSVERNDSNGVNMIDIAMEYIKQCSGIELDMNDCLTARTIDAITRDRPEVRRRFLQEDSCEAPGGFGEEMLHSLFLSARQQCLFDSVVYSENDFKQGVNLLLDYFGAENCWVSLCEDARDRSGEYMIILLDMAAKCAGVDDSIVNTCLWDNVFGFLISPDEDRPIGPRRILSHDDINDICYRPSQAEIGLFIGTLLKEAGMSCINLDQEFGHVEIEIVYNEMIKFFTASPKCVGGMSMSFCEGGVIDKKSEEEIATEYTDFVRGNAGDMLLQCANVQADTCVTSKALELLSENVQNCASPSIDDLDIDKIVNAALSWCSSESIQVGVNDRHKAVDDLIQLVSRSECWETICQQDFFKNELFQNWMYMCSAMDLKFLYSNAERTVTHFGVSLENDKLKCMADYILRSKGNGGESHECGVIELGPNVCGADFDLGKKAYMACSEYILMTESPTPMPVSFSMSYSFDQNPLLWNDFEWVADENKVEDKTTSTFIKEEEEPIEVEYIPYGMSFSYSFDDITFDHILEYSMSYDYDSAEDDDEYPPSHYEQLAHTYVMEVCHLLESIQYNLAARDCIKPLCEIGIEGAFLYNSGRDPPISTPITATESTPAPTFSLESPIPTMPSASPTTKSITLKPTTKATANPTNAKFGSVDVKFNAAITLDGIGVSDLDFTALDAVVDLLEKIFASMLPEGALVRLLKVGGASVTRRMLRILQDAVQGVEIEFEVTITEKCKDRECSNSEDLSTAIYDNATANLQKKIKDGTLSTAIQNEADAEGIPELANVSIKPDSLKASEPTVTVKKSGSDDDDPTDDNNSASCMFKSTLSLIIALAWTLFNGGFSF